MHSNASHNTDAERICSVLAAECHNQPHRSIYGAVHLHTAKSKQWLCSTATAPNRKSENMSLSGGGDFAFSTRVYYSL